MLSSAADKRISPSASSSLPSLAYEILTVARLFLHEIGVDLISDILIFARSHEIPLALRSFLSV